MYEKGMKKLGKDLNLIDHIKTQKNLKTLAKCQNILTKER
jgi:flagellin-specific chaperone FliS